MPPTLDVYQRLLWDIAPIGEKKPEVMYVGLLYAATCTILPGVDMNVAYKDTLKWTSLLLSAFDTPVTDSIDLAQYYITTKFGNRTLAITASHIVGIWLNTRHKKKPRLTDKQRGEIVYHLSGMIVVLSSIFQLEHRTLDMLYEQLLP